MEIVIALFLMALVFFVLDGFRVPASVSWTPLAWAWAMAGLMYYLYETTSAFR